MLSIGSDYLAKLSADWVCRTILLIRITVWLCHREWYPYFYLVE